jgi:hypothetical protein
MPCCARLNLAGMASAQAAHGTALPARTLKQAQPEPQCPAGCADKQCVPDTTPGGFKCALCQPSLLLDSVTGTCQCPAGKFGDPSAARLCADCLKGYYCPGGRYTGEANAPAALACADIHPKLTTAGRRAKSVSACGEYLSPRRRPFNCSTLSLAVQNACAEQQRCPCAWCAVCTLQLHTLLVQGALCGLCTHRAGAMVLRKHTSLSCIALKVSSSTALEVSPARPLCLLVCLPLQSTRQGLTTF